MLNDDEPYNCTILTQFTMINGIYGRKCSQSFLLWVEVSFKAYHFWSVETLCYSWMHDKVAAD